MIKHLTKIPIILAFAMNGGCQPPAQPPARPPQHIEVPEHYHFTFDARPGDDITVIMDPTGDPVARCLDMGGEPIYNPFTLISTCDKVDF